MGPKHRQAAQIALLAFLLGVACTACRAPGLSWPVPQKPTEVYHELGGLPGSANEAFVMSTDALARGCPREALSTLERANYAEATPAERVQVLAYR
jgi:hypothetical protein